MEINWDKVSDEQTPAYEPLPEGDYVFTVEQCEEKESLKGNEYWALELSVDGEEKAKVFFNLFFTEKTLNNCKHFFKQLGLNPKGTNHIIPLDVIGKSFKGTLSIVEYTDRNGNKKLKNDLDVWSVSAVKKDIVDKEEIPF